MSEVSGRPGDVPWVRFVWDLRNLPSIPTSPTSYQFRSAWPQEADTIAKTVISAYKSDATWGPLLSDIEERMRERIFTTFGKPGTDYIVAVFDGNVVAVSGIARAHSTDQNLLTGVCVEPEHQRKGLGKYLLGLSLVRLREMGLEKARVYTRAGSLADRKLYSLFGSTREKGVVYPAVKSTSSN